MKNTAKFLGVAYFVFMVTLAIKDVGKQACTTPYVYEWDLPFLVGLVVILPFVLGYLSNWKE